MEFDRVINEAARAGLAAGANDQHKGPTSVQKTYSMGKPLLDLTKALALVDELEGAETIRKMKLAENR